MKIEIRETMDGSRTLYLKEIDEHYHSTFGAIQESRHVYIREGFNQCLLRDIRVLEIGFGTGALIVFRLLLMQTKRTYTAKVYIFQVCP